MRRNLPIILLFTFLDFLALSIFFGTAIQLILASHSILQLSSTTDHAWLFGLTLLILPIGQFLIGPLWGQLADNYGRKITLLITLYSSCIGFILMAYAISTQVFWLFIIGRIVSSCVSVNHVLGQASLADTSQGVQKTKRFNLQFIIVSCSFISGPYLIKWTTHSIAYSHIYWLIAAGYLLAFLLVILSFKETLKQVAPKSIKLVLNIERIFSVFKATPLRRIFLIWIVFQAGWNLFFQYSGEFLYSGRHMTNSDINFLFSHVSLGALLAQILLVHPLAQKILPERIIPWAIAAIGGSLVLSGLVPIGLGFYCLLGVYCVGIGSFLTNFNTYVSNNVSHEHQGGVLAMLAASQALMNIIVTFAGNFLTTHFLPTPYILGGIIVLVSLLFWRRA